MTSIISTEIYITMCLLLVLSDRVTISQNTMICNALNDDIISLLLEEEPDL